MTFALQLITSFLIGGIFIALQTLFGERSHGYWRAVILTIPSTLALGLLFVGLTKTPLDGVEAAIVVPAALGPDYLYVAIFAALSSFGLFLSTLAGLTVWAIGAYSLIQFPPATFFSSVFFYGLPMILAGYFIVRKLPQIHELKPFPMTAAQIAIRSLIGGTIIALIVILSKTWGNIWGGLFSAFPAAFTSTFIIYYHWQGARVIPAVAKSLFFPGSIGFIIYAWIAAATFPLWGIWLGTLAAYGGTFLFFAIFYIISHAKLRV